MAVASSSDSVCAVFGSWGFDLTLVVKLGAIRCLLAAATAQLGFNDLRDNETRSARHASRTPLSLQSLSINSAHRRYPLYSHVPIDASDISSMLENVTLHNNTFHAHTSKHKHLSFRAQDIIDNKSSWASTSPRAFELQQCMLLQVLHSAGTEHNPALWPSSLYREHTVISRGDAAFYYVVRAAPKALLLWQLLPIAGNVFTFDFTLGSWTIAAPENLDQFKCWLYELSLEESDGGFSTRFTLGDKVVSGPAQAAVLVFVGGVAQQ